MQVLRRPGISLKQMVYAAMFGALTAVGAFIVIPLQPVPITLQNFFAGLAGVLLGGYAAAMSQVIYLLLGVIGLPVFAGGKAGLGALFGPTGGYLIGFVVGAYVIGKIVQVRREAGFLWILLALAAGYLVIYTLGTLHLSLVAHLSLVKAFLVGVVPFLPGDLVKILAVALLSVKMKKYRGLY